MRPLIITSGGAPAKVIRTYRDEIQRISNCMLLDTSLTDVKELGPIEENNPGYFIMTEGKSVSLPSANFMFGAADRIVSYLFVRAISILLLFISLQDTNPTLVTWIAGLIYASRAWDETPARVYW